MTKNKIKRNNLLPEKCSRCGNDLMTGMSIYHLPFLKKYIIFCVVCHIGLRLPTENFVEKNATNEEWKKFWEEEIDE